MRTPDDRRIWSDGPGSAASSTIADPTRAFGSTRPWAAATIASNDPIAPRRPAAARISRPLPYVARSAPNPAGPSRSTDSRSAQASVSVGPSSRGRVPAATDVIQLASRDC